MEARKFKRGVTVAFTAGLIAAGSAGPAPAQVVQGEGWKSVDANGSIRGGTNADVQALVSRGSTAGKVCVSLKGYLKRDTAWERGCGPATVEIDDLLNTARVRGSVPTSYGKGPNWYEGTYFGTSTVTVDITVTGTGTVRPADAMYPRYCNVLYWGNCLAPVSANRTVERSGTGSGTVVSQKLRTSDFSAGATLYMQRGER